MEIIAGLIIIACGAFSICGAVFDWDWFMNNYKAKPFMALFGRKGTRIFYGILGGFIALLGILAMIGTLPIFD